MKKLLLSLALLSGIGCLKAQTNPSITAWMQNDTGITGRHYVAGNSTPIDDSDLANVQAVNYDTNWVYVSATGIPAYITGPFQDGNPSLATDQGAIYKMSLNPEHNTGTPTNTTGGNIGVFINGVSLFDYRDGVAWNPNTNAVCGGPGNAMCPGGPAATMAWNRDAVPAEKEGFDCNKAHPAMGNYHHHQNPSAFDLDLIEVSEVCDTYPADGLYVIDVNAHSPLIGFAYDGFPIYGAYGYANINGTGGIVRIQSSYELSGATTRVDGPDIDATYFDGYFREDYLFVSHTEDYYLDQHNGRFAVTPEFPLGTYAYYATVDANHNSAYPYTVGPTFYGNVTTTIVSSVPVDADQYLDINDYQVTNTSITTYPNPTADIISVQINDMSHPDLKVQLVTMLGQLVSEQTIREGATLCNFDTTSLYNGTYFVIVNSNSSKKSFKVIVNKSF
jgi:hypothetical protein